MSVPFDYVAILVIVTGARTTPKKLHLNLNIFQRRSLKTRVTLFTLAIFVISIWALALYASGVLRENLQRTLGEQQFSTVSIVAAQINDELGDRLRALEITAGRISPTILGNAAATQAILDESPVLQDMFNGGVTVLIPDGTAIADSPISTGRRGRNFMNIDYVAATLAEGKPSIGKAIAGPVLKKPVFGMAAPILDTKGKAIGALSGVTNLGMPNFLDKITNGAYGKTGGYTLIDYKQRLIVTGQDRNRIMSPLPPKGSIKELDRFVDGYNGTQAYVNPLGIEWLASTKNIPRTTWYLGLTLPTAEAFAPIHDMRQRILLAAGVLTLLAGTLTWWMLRRQLNPMVAAARVLGLMSNTKQPMEPLPVASQDEIGELIGGFNRLLETLGKREEDLHHFRVAMDATVDGIYLVDRASMRFIDVNDGACRIQECTRDEMLALGPEGVASTSREELARIYDAIIASVERAEPIERRRLRKDGSPIWLELNRSALRSAKGWMIVAVARDVTERKRAQESAMHAHEQLRQLATRLNSMHEAESGLLSRELHDEFGQMLTSVKMDLSWIASRLDHDSAELKKKVASSLALVDASVQSVRSIASRLRPRILDELGLPSAIDWLVQDFRDRSGLDSAFIASAPADTLTPEQSTAAFRIVQESLINIARHADAKRIDVSLYAQGEWLTVEVRDDGKGLPEQETTNYESIGLLGMRERALSAGGELTLKGVRGRGTVVTLRLPIYSPKDTCI